MGKRNIIRDWVVYHVASAWYLLLRGHVKNFFRDIAYFSQWRKYRISEKDTLDHRVPWLVFSAVEYLGHWVKKNMKIFEYGSGGSTLYFSSRADGVISVEHDRKWYCHTRKAIENAGLSNVQYQLCEPEQNDQGPEKKIGNPDHYLSSFPEYDRMHFEKYVRVIDQYPDAWFDLVVVDGRARPSCIAHALSKIKKNGFLLVDNADRKSYLEPFPGLREGTAWEQLKFMGHFPFGPASVLNTTSLFLKKAEN